MAERIEIGINDVYLSSKPQSSVRVMDGKAEIQSWLVDTPNEVIEQSIDAVCKDDVFEALESKRMINKIMKFCNPSKITIEPKE